MKEDNIIKVLKWMRNKGKFTEEEYEVERERYDDRDLIYSTIHLKSVNGEGNEHYRTISLDDRMKLLEFEEYQQALKSSNQARWIAFVSIAITIIVSSIQIYQNNPKTDKFGRVITPDVSIRGTVEVEGSVDCNVTNMADIDLYLE